jgi:DNA-binding response OmpR family regulator
MAPSVHADHRISGDRARVLIVEDETALLTAFSRALGRDYTVERASSGVAALSTLAASPPFDVVLCDMNLGDIAGSSVYTSACERWPELRARFLFMTGERDSDVPGFGDGSSAMRVLVKPFDFATLRAAVADLLDGSPRGGAA